MSGYIAKQAIAVNRARGIIALLGVCTPQATIGATASPPLRIYAPNNIVAAATGTIALNIVATLSLSLGVG